MGCCPAYPVALAVRMGTAFHPELFCAQRAGDPGLAACGGSVGALGSWLVSISTLFDGTLLGPG